MDPGHVMAKTVDYFYRKAGKDLYDIGFLLARHTSASRVRDIADETGLEGDLMPLLAREPPAPLVFFARAMADEEGDTVTRAWLDQWAREHFS